MMRMSKVACEEWAAPFHQHIYALSADQKGGAPDLNHIGDQIAVVQLLASDQRK